MIIGSIWGSTSNAFLRSNCSPFLRHSAAPIQKAARFCNSRIILHSAIEGETSAPTSNVPSEPSWDIPVHLSEGLFAVEKPLNWTSSDVVTNIRGILERDAKSRGSKVVSVLSRHNKSRKVKVGHGGTLDPLASGVLVIGVGRGTKELQEYVFLFGSSPCLI